MKQTKYVYNSQTCHYERARITFRDVLLYTLSLVFISSVFFASIVFLHNQFVETDYEIALRKENRTLEQHKPLLQQELNNIEATLQKLHGEERTLYTRIFNIEPPTHAASHPTLSKETVLLADASGFRSLLNTLHDHTSALLDKSSQSNTDLSDNFSLNDRDLTTLLSIPSIQPISNPDNGLASGFGKRINPFHKGIYFHPGVDFIAARGTEVMATAKGTVVSVSRNDLQAGYGNQVVIDHGNGFSTRYAHLQGIFVKQGQQVTKRMVIATVGNSGGSIAPHLHYEIIRDGKVVDPALYFLEGLNSAQHQELIDLSKKQNQSLD